MTLPLITLFIITSLNDQKEDKGDEFPNLRVLELLLLCYGFGGVQSFLLTGQLEELLTMVVDFLVKKPQKGNVILPHNIAI